MNREEALKLLTLASARDGRALDEVIVAVWADDLSDITYDEGIAAAREHYRTSDAWLTPFHVVRNVKAARQAGMTMSPEAPGDCGNHKWAVDGTCLNCLARNPRVAEGQWHAPGWGDGIPADKPGNFDEMVAAAAAKTREMVAQGASRGDNSVRTAAWNAAEGARRGQK